MPDRRPAPDLVQLLKLMSLRSEIVEMQLAAEPASNLQGIEELPPAAPSVLDQLVQARVRIEEQALEEVPTGLAAPLFTEPPLDPPADAPVGRISTLEPEAWPTAEDDASMLESAAIAADEPDVDLLELNASEAGQPAQIEPLDLSSFDDEVDEEAAAPAAAEQTIEADELLAQPLESIAPATETLRDEAVEEEEEPAAAEGDLPAIEPLAEAAQLEPEDEPGSDEGPGEDFQALLAGARQLAPDAVKRPRDEEEVPLLPAQADVRLRARNGPKPGAEFIGKSTLAGAGGLYCLIERFDLPAGTRMKVTLGSSRMDDTFEIQDALVKRVRRAPENTTEVQLAFEQRHEDLEAFVAQHFGDQPVGFTLFPHRRSKH